MRKLTGAESPYCTGVLHKRDRQLQLDEGVSMRLMLFRMMLLRMRFLMFLRTRSRGLITMVQYFQVVCLIHLY